MKIEPKILNNVCITTHPQGIVADVKRQIDYVRAQKPFPQLSASANQENANNVLVIGSSAGFGLASRITLAFGAQATTVGVAYEKGPSAKRPGTPGYYCNAVFEAAAQKAGLKSHTINGDAFSTEIKQETLAAIRRLCPEGLNMVVYSLASPMRTDPVTAETYRSVLKPIGRDFTSQTVDFMSGKVNPIQVGAASEDEQLATIKVMGGEDWALWLDALQNAGLLAQGARAVAYSYIGPELTYPIYWHGTIGKAKADLEKTAAKLNQDLIKIGGGAYISVNKALVTRASSVIPVVPLYVALLYKVMKKKGLHEECIEQMVRLFSPNFCGLYGPDKPKLDEAGRIRIDDWEMREDVQSEVAKLWGEVNSENLLQISDIEGFRSSYLCIHGFGLEGINYENEIDPLEMPDMSQI